MEPVSRLSVSGQRIVNRVGLPILLRGVCLGGWMNMENFIDGYPGSEHGLRAAMAEELGPGKADFFFERLLDHFLTEADIAFIKGLGATVVRIPLNYRHFEADSNPFAYLERGFSRLDRVLEWCGRHGLYAILDMHAAPGWQNTDWHSDNANRQALLWEHPHFQERFVRLWSALAARYRSNPIVAGYDLLNEPVTGAPRGCFSEARYHTRWEALNGLYRRTVEVIRAQDAETIIFLEGDFFSMFFQGLEKPFTPNLAYSGHAYSLPCFGPGPYPGELRGERWDLDRQRKAFETQEGLRFSRDTQAPFWVGEFGAVYDGPAAESADRLRALDDQLSIFNAAGIHWTCWTYKDVGIMSWMGLHPECDYLQRVAPVLKNKKALDTDFWMEWSQPTPAKTQAADLARLVFETIAEPDLNLPDTETYFRQASLSNFAGELLQPSYARCFRDLPEEKIDAILQSFRFENCCAHAGLVETVQKHL